MSVDATQITQTATTQTQTTIETPAQSVESALARYPLAALGFLAAIVAVVLLAFAFLLVAAVAANSGVAQHYLANIFSATAVWVAVAAIAGVGAYLAPSPVKR